jgi:hypothetical protein
LSRWAWTLTRWGGKRGGGVSGKGGDDKHTAAECACGFDLPLGSLPVTAVSCCSLLGAAVQHLPVEGWDTAGVLLQLDCRVAHLLLLLVLLLWLRGCRLSTAWSCTRPTSAK